MRWGTLAALLALMIASKGAEVSGLLSRAAARIASMTSRPVLALTYLVAATAPVVMNDTVILVYAPIAASVARLCGYPLAALVTYVTIAANVGSALTPFGNPQNLIIWSHYGPSITGFVLTMAPLTAAGLAILTVPVARLPRKRVGRMPPVRLDRPLAASSLAALAAGIALIELGHPLLALALAAALVGVARPRAILAVDYAVLGILGLMLLDFRALAAVLAPYMPHASGGLGGVMLAAVLSQAVSNVPATALLLGTGVGWRSLAVGTNLGGVWLVTGSLANILAIRLTGIGVRDMHRHQLPYAAALTAATAGMLLAGTLSY